MAQVGNAVLRMFLLAGAAAMPGVAQAQEVESAPGSEPATAQPAGINDIIVTARKREERLIDVPVAVTVLGEEALARYSTSDVESIGTQIPQVILTRSPGASGGGQLTIRGIGSTAAGDDSIEQAVSFNLDGVSAARGGLITQAMFDLSSVQVLKGPQALYFGKNSPAGVLVVESRNPGSKLEGFVRAGYEFKADEYQVEGAIGGPVTDTFGVRLAFFRSDMSKGYVRNIAPPRPAATSPVAFDRANGFDLPGGSYEWGPGSEQTAGRLTLAWHPTSQFDATVKVLASDYRDDGELSTFVNTTCPGGQRLQIDLGGILYTGAPGVLLDESIKCGKTRTQSIGSISPTMAAFFPGSNGGKPFTHVRNYLGSATLNYNADNFILTSVTGYFDGKRAAFDYYDQTSYALIPARFNSKLRSFSEELRLLTRFDGSINLSAGAFYSNDKKDYDYVSGLVRAFDPVQGGNLYSAAGKVFNKGHSFSAFAELTWKLTPDLELAGGARYTKEKKRAKVFNTYVQPGLVSALGVALPVTDAQGRPIILNGRISQSNVSPQVTLTWHPTGETTLFAGYRTGFKSGGIANPGLIPADATNDSIVYRAEKARGYEAGFKFSLSDPRLTGDITIYDYNYKGLQVSSFDVVANALKITNAAGATTSGVEGALNFNANPNLSFRTAIGYNRARYSKFDTAPGVGGGTQDLTGKPLTRAPSWQLSGGFTWDTPISSSMGLAFNADGRYSSSYFPATTDSPATRQDGYAVLDAAVRLHDADDRWELALIGKNITNSYYLTVSTETALAVPVSEYGVAGNPRTVALQGTFRF